MVYGNGPYPLTSSVPSRQSCVFVLPLSCPVFATFCRFSFRPSLPRFFFFVPLRITFRTISPLVHQPLFAITNQWYLPIFLALKWKTILRSILWLELWNNSSNIEVAHGLIEIDYYRYIDERQFIIIFAIVNFHANPIR